ncbi:HNH endonuclease [Citrifermentans bemidjiense Bem]|uniref:HNH endonuclease n=1 Tax=Citrifermentans bemidjiense (strain ATCC BAA-1014 / DSM 16622 / JCM 12645 / Bem) TaxID=404380 RepID=B5EI94_CITBB|nr:HNH endonuclease signature motif containing protein [Citrifermentans bemidjiense]ACH39796.1 HNH endonuclease [Citrifermentans bemidjiense Bem]
MNSKFSQLVEFAEQHQGRPLSTLGNRSSFLLEVSESSFTYTPVTTQRPRRQKLIHAGRVFERYLEIGSLKTSKYTDLTVNSSYILALIKAFSEKEPTMNEEKVHEFASNAINDLDEIPQGVAEPERSSHTTSSYARDHKVRAYVIARAKGTCEYCGELGFLMSNGKSYYLEAHHVIALADEGRDTPDNVIALCPKHHKEAHFGINRDEIEEEMMIFLSTLSKKARNNRAARRR